MAFFRFAWRSAPADTVPGGTTDWAVPIANTSIRPVNVTSTSSAVDQSDSTF